MPVFATLVRGLLLAPALTGALRAEDTADDLFLRARTLAGQKRREEARALCLKALQRSPDYHEIRVYLARLYGWDGQYGPGQEALRYVLEREPGNLEAREAAMDLAIWADQPHEALKLCQDGLALAPRSAPLLYRKARILKSLGDLDGAGAAVRAALEADPGDPRARLLRDDLNELTQRSRVGVSYTYDTFDHTFAPWRMLTVSGAYRFGFGSLIARVNRAERFGEQGTQVEMDAYPHLAEGTYLYLNAGTSSASIFPTFRAGGELYHNFPRGIEASLGMRYLRFSDSVTIYTGSLGKYHGDDLYTLRVNLTPSAIGSSVSGSLTLRHYLEDADSFLSASVSSGRGIDQWAPNADILRLRSQSASLGWQRKFRRGVIVSAGVALERQEYLPGSFRQDRTFSAGLDKRF